VVRNIDKYIVVCGREGRCLVLDSWWEQRGWGANRGSGVGTTGMCSCVASFVLHRPIPFSSFSRFSKLSCLLVQRHKTPTTTLGRSEGVRRGSIGPLLMGGRAVVPKTPILNREKKIAGIPVPDKGTLPYLCTYLPDSPTVRMTTL
jgi:hypothetical protein